MICVNCFIKLSHVYPLAGLLFCLAFLALLYHRILTGEPNSLGNQAFQWSIFQYGVKWLLERWLCKKCPVSQCIATEPNVSVCSYYWNYYFTDDLTQNLPHFCFICDWRHPDSLWPLPAVMLCYIKVTHYTPWCWTIWRVIFWEM